MTSDQGVTDPRIAVLVYNDCANDSRVLKESASLRDEGYTVQILAVERRELGRMAAVTQLGQRLHLERVPEFAMERILPTLAPLWRRLISDPVGAPPAPPAPPSPARATLGTRMKTTVVRALRSTGERLFRTVSLGTYWAGVVRAGYRFSPHAIHANDGNTLVPALLIRALLPGRIPVIYDSHELWRHRNVRQDRLLAPLFEAVTESIGIGRVEGVITVSPSIADWLQRAYRLRRAPTLVRNVPVADGSPDRSTGILRERAGLSEDDRVIAYGGRITTARGIEETIDALPYLDENVHFVLLGYGEEAALETVRNQAAAHSIGHRVHLIGAVEPDEVSRSLADGDVAVVHVRPICLSYRYALPNKLFESIRAGLPIAAADLPDMAEVVSELGVGEVFAGSSSQDLAAALQAILEDPEAYRERARAVASHLTWEQEIVGMLAMYRELLPTRPSGAEEVLP